MWEKVCYLINLLFKHLSGIVYILEGIEKGCCRERICDCPKDEERPDQGSRHGCKRSPACLAIEMPLKRKVPSEMRK